MFVDYGMGAVDPATEDMLHAASHAKVGLSVLSPDFIWRERMDVQGVAHFLG